MWTPPTAYQLSEDEETAPLYLPDDEDVGLWVGIEVSNRCRIDGHVNAHGEVEFDLAGRGAGARICFASNALHRFVALANHLDPK
jgi:hypothetical protein